MSAARAGPSRLDSSLAQGQSPSAHTLAITASDSSRSTRCTAAAERCARGCNAAASAGSAAPAGTSGCASPIQGAERGPL